MNGDMNERLSKTTRNKDEDWLDAALRSATPEPLADDGFTARVMQAVAWEEPAIVLPPPEALERLRTRRRDERRWVRYSAMGGAVGAAAAAAVWIVVGSSVGGDPLLAALAGLLGVAVAGWSLGRPELV